MRVVYMASWIVFSLSFVFSLCLSPLSVSLLSFVFSLCLSPLSVSLFSLSVSLLSLSLSSLLFSLSVSLLSLSLSSLTLHSHSPLSLSRIVVFVDLLNELIEVALAKFSNLTDAQKMEVAMYIIPEVSSVPDIVASVGKDGPLAQSVERCADNAKVESSRLPWTIFFFSFFF